jgi:hypothetical protein
MGHRCTEEAGEFIFFCGKGNENQELATVFFFFNKRMMSVVRRVELMIGSHT